MNGRSLNEIRNFFSIRPHRLVKTCRYRYIIMNYDKLFPENYNHFRTEIFHFF